MIDFGITLSADTVELRPLQQTDCKALSKHVSDPAMWVYFISDLSVQGELDKWVAEAIAQTTAGMRLAFAIVDKASGLAVGSTSFGNISLYDQRIEIGWTWIAKAYQRTGVNKQIKYLMFKYAFETLQMERVELKTDVLNVNARKAMLSYGITEEGVLRSHTLMTHNRRRDTIYYSVLRSEWEQVKKGSETLLAG